MKIKVSYSYDDKLKLKNKIEKINNKDILLEILSIINAHTNKKITVNEEYTYIFFDKLKSEAYPKINAIVNKFNKKKDVHPISAEYLSTIGIIDEKKNTIKFNGAERKFIKKVRTSQTIET